MQSQKKILSAAEHSPKTKKKKGGGNPVTKRGEEMILERQKEQMTLLGMPRASLCLPHSRLSFILTVKGESAHSGSLLFCIENSNQL